MGYAGKVATIFAKDLRAELRTKEAVNASLSFALWPSLTPCVS